MLRFANNAEETVALALTPESTTINLDGSAYSAGFSASYGDTMLATLTHASLAGIYEVVAITDVQETSLTVIRSVEGAEPQSWPAGTKISVRVTAGMLYRFLQRDPMTGLIGGNSFVFALPTNQDHINHAGVAANTAFVFNGRSRQSETVMLAAYPLLQKVTSIPAASSGGDTNFSYPSTGGTAPVDLGVPSPWELGAGQRWNVVVPTVANGYQYWADPESLMSEELAETAEPAFTSDGETVWLEDGAWIPTPMPVLVNPSFQYDLMVDEVGFIKFSGAPATMPTVSIGTQADPTMFANAVALNQLSDGQVHRIPITSNKLIRDLRFSVVDAATGGPLIGRFYWRGQFIEI